MNTIKTNKLELSTYDDLAINIYVIGEKLLKLVKLYDDPDYIDEVKDFIELMSYLNEDKIFTELVKPEEIVKCIEYDCFPKKIIRFGYTMEYLKRYESLCDKLLTQGTTDKKRYLKEISDILKRINMSGIVYSDIHDENIMVDSFSDGIRFIDPDSVKINGINTYDIKQDELKEKKMLTQLSLEKLYEYDMSFNYYVPLSQKLKGLEVTPELREYVQSIENKELPKEFIMDFNKDLENDVIRFNRKILERR